MKLLNSYFCKEEKLKEIKRKLKGTKGKLKEN